MNYLIIQEIQNSLTLPCVNEGLVVVSNYRVFVDENNQIIRNFYQ